MGTGSAAALWFAAFIGFMLVLAAARTNSYPIVEEHNIQVKLKVADNKWAMHSDESGDFLYTACADFPNDRVIWPGYVAKRARWIDTGSCKSIRDAGLGFFWQRDKDYNAKEIQ